MKRMVSPLLALALSAGLSLVAEERAQISGVIRDSSNGALTSASVSIVNQDTGIRRSTQSDAAGEYVVAGLPAGLYKITVRRPGFQTIARLNVKLNPAEESRLDFTMQIGSMREVVTIRGSPPLMNVDDASVGLLATRDVIETLPLFGRELLGVVSLAPGVVATPATLGEAGQFSASGQRPNANYFTVDGVSANTGVGGSATPAQFSGSTLPVMTAFGGSQALAPVEDIDEVRVQTSSFAPEFGRAPGANVSVVSRSGTNELHGSAFYTGRGAAFAANDWFANASGLPRNSARLNDGGGSLGGPLHRDRSFFFVDYEWLRFLQPFTWRSAVPSLAARDQAPAPYRPVLAAFPLPNGPPLGGGLAELVASASRPSQLDAGGVRVDHALTSRINVFGRFQRAPSTAESGFSHVDRSQFDYDSVTIGASLLAAPNITSDARVNFTRNRVASQWIATEAGGAAPVDLRPLLDPASLFGSGGGTLLYGFGIGGIGQILSGEASGSRQDQWNVIETAGWNSGVHAVRFGIDYVRLSPSRDAIASTVSGTFGTLGDLLANRPMLFSSSRADRASSLIETMAFFAQDTWRIVPRLTATYGLRWELTPAPAYRFMPSQPQTVPPPAGGSPGSSGGTGSASGNPSSTASLPVWPTRYTQLAPRLGIAYDFGTGTVLRAGWGVFYDVNFAVATDPINAFPYNRWQFGGAIPTSPAASIGGIATGYGYAPDLKLPYAREWNISLEHVFRRADVMSMSYVGSASRRLLRREAALSQEASLAIAPLATNNGRADFHALEIQYRRGLSAGLQVISAYTWSHSIDNGSWDSGIYLPETGARRDRGSSSFDMRQNVSAGLTWRTPGSGNRVLRNWNASALVTARSGFPIDVLSAENFFGLSFDDFKRPDLVRGVPVWTGNRLNPAAFVVPQGTTQGNLGRNSVHGFGLAQADVSIGRDFAVREESVLSIRLDAFNVLNAPHFADPVRFLNSPLFGQSASMLNLMLGSGTPHSGMAPAFLSGGPRVLEIRLRLRF